MVLVPRCSCKGAMVMLSAEASIAYTRIMVKELGYSKKEAIETAVAMDRQRLRLVCQECKEKYVIAGEKRVAINCICDGVMIPMITENKKLQSHQWLESKWLCRDCDYKAPVQRLLEQATIFVWHEKDRMLTRKLVPARSIRKMG